MKKCLFFVVLIFQCAAVSAHGLEVPKLRGYVNDYAGMISPQAAAKIEGQLRTLEASDSTQIVVLTVSSLEGEPIESFSIRVAEAWKIGGRGKDNGALLIVSKQDRKIRVEVGRGLEGKLTDLMAGRIVDQVIKPRFKQGDFDGGFLAGVSALTDGVRGEFIADRNSARRQEKGFPPFLTVVLFLGVFTLICGSLSRILGGTIAAIGLPALAHVFPIFPVGIVATLLLALVGFGVGFLLPSLFSSKGSRRSGHGPRGNGFIFGPGNGGHWHASGGSDSDGGFSGGGGSFGGGGASGDW